MTSQLVQAACTNGGQWCEAGEDFATFLGRIDARASSATSNTILVQECGAKIGDLCGVLGAGSTDARFKATTETVLAVVRIVVLAATGAIADEESDEDDQESGRESDEEDQGEGAGAEEDGEQSDRLSLEVAAGESEPGDELEEELTRATLLSYEQECEGAETD